MATKSGKSLLIQG